MNKLIILVLLGFAPNLFGQEVFNPPVLLKAADQIIDHSSHTAMSIYDFNNDSLKDLIVGEFGDIPLEGMKDDPVYGRYVQGRCHIYLNLGSNENPKYGEDHLLLAGGEPAFVPITCCIGFTPRFIDLDGDKIDDIISGSYPGEIYFFKGEGRGVYSKSEILMDSDGDTLNAAHSSVAEPFDYDNDGDIDLLISSRMNGTFLSINEGSGSNPKFSKGKLIPLPKYDYVYTPLKEPRKSNVSHVHPIDWDGDGLFDLVCGTEEGHLVWYKNSGTKKKAEFLKAETLFTSQSGWDNLEGGPVIPLGGRCKVFANDYNLDGKLDLLVGDFYSSTKVTRELRPEEEMDWDKAKKKNRDLLLKLKEMYPDVKQFRNVAFFNKFEGLSKKEIRKIKKINAEIEEANKVTAKFQKLQEHFGHGYVWLFTQK